VKRSRWTALASVAAMMAVLGGCGGKGTLATNATPIITNLFPSNITAGSQGFVLAIKGTGFISSAKGVSFAYWNGSARSTTYSATTGELTVFIPASDVASPGLGQVTVFNPAPGGGSSAPLSFSIETFQAAGPQISSFAPPSATAGGAAFTLTVNGSNFAAGDVVTWNGSQRATTYNNAKQVTAAITQDDIATAGFASVAVAEPGLVVASPSLTYQITGPNNPAPAISSLSPSSVAAGGPDLEVFMEGSDFVSSSVAEWSGTPLATAYLSGSQLMVMIPAADTASATSANITVTSPAPGGGTSGSLTFTVQ